MNTVNTLKQAVLTAIDDAKEWEPRGMGLVGLVRDYCELDHWDDVLQDEVDCLVDSLRGDSVAFNTESELFELVNDHELTEPPVWAQEDHVVHAGVQSCFDYLDRHGVESPRNVSGLYFALYHDLHRALVKAVCEVAETIEKGM